MRTRLALLTMSCAIGGMVLWSLRHVKMPDLAQNAGSSYEAWMAGLQFHPPAQKAKSDPAQPAENAAGAQTAATKDSPDERGDYTFQERREQKEQFFREDLGLTPDETDALRDLEDQLNSPQREVAEDSSAENGEHFHEMREQTIERIQQLLGPERYARYEEFSRRQTEEMPPPAGQNE